VTKCALQDKKNLPKIFHFPFFEGGVKNKLFCSSKTFLEQGLAHNEKISQNKSNKIVLFVLINLMDSIVVKNILRNLEILSKYQKSTIL
jgi:hypothetical protein